MFIYLSRLIPILKFGRIFISDQFYTKLTLIMPAVKIELSAWWRYPPSLINIPFLCKLWFHSRTVKILIFPPFLSLQHGPKLWRVRFIWACIAEVQIRLGGQNLIRPKAPVSCHSSNDFTLNRLVNEIEKIMELTETRTLLLKNFFFK